MIPAREKPGGKAKSLNDELNRSDLRLFFYNHTDKWKKNKSYPHSTRS